ncbi:two-component system, OmpR family, response regulator VicR [Enterococcus sp. AZ170]|uniref:winged helix-turn-helix transcriptional regulator n=1 Tax=Enterococcus sp. AZ170 TaxID=2774747 RepID=UPI003D2FD3DA
MYNIGVVSSNPEIENTTYIKALKESEYNVHYLKEKHKWERQTCELDALIIEEEESDNQMSLICESIIKIREQTSALVWVLSQNTDKSTRIVYLKLGADAIIDTSIDSEELVLLIKGHLKRYSEKKQRGLKVYEETPLQESDVPKKIELVHSNFSVLLNGSQEVNLTKLEFRTIELLSNHVGQALTYEEIYKNVWDGGDEDKQYRVANIIYHLRRKIENEDHANGYIKTIRSKGYMLMN